MQSQKQLTGWLGMLISIAFIYWIFRTVDFLEVWQTIARVKPIYLFFTGFVFLITPLLRTLRWRLMLPNHQGYLDAIVIGFAGNNVLPARGGELVRMEYFHQKNPNTSRVTIISSIATAKLLDGLCLVVLLSLSMSQLALDEQVWLNNIERIAIPLILVLLLLILSVRIWGNTIKIYLSSFRAKFLKAIVSTIHQTQKALQFLQLDWVTLGVLFITVSIWLAEAAMFAVCLKAFNIQISLFWLSIFTMAVVNFGIATPSSPGFFGVFQGAVLLALSPFNVDPEIAIGIGLIANFFQFLPLTIWGFFIFLKWRRKKK